MMEVAVKDPVIEEITEDNMLEKIEKGIDMTVDGIRAFIDRAQILAKQGIQIEIPVKHHFSKDLYMREMSVPKGALIFGRIHRYQNASIISKGEVTVLSIDGVMRVKAPFTMVSSPGVKRMIFAHEDTVWTTVHGTSETDIEKIEADLACESYDQVVTIKEKLQLTSEVK